MTALPGPQLSRYLALTMLRWIGGFFLLGTAIIALADAIELIRRTVDRATFDAGTALLASLLKTPSLTEEFLPFAVLFGAIAGFLSLNRRLELAVLRASGVSAWQFVAPALLVAATLGILATTVYNPLSAASREASERLSAQVLGKEAQLLTAGGRSPWFRQEAPDGHSLMRANAASSDGLTLTQVEAHLFDEDDAFVGRLEASRATLTDGAWVLTNVARYDAGGIRTTAATATVPTRLSAAEVSSAVARPDTVSFWALPAAVALAERAGLPSHRYALQRQILLARPLLLAAMVLIAASVSLRLVRLGGVGRAVLGGVIAGFALYLGSAITADLGEADAIPATIAAWLPGTVGALFGVSSLLWTEDG